jgi:hypothetical protein
MEKIIFLIIVLVIFKFLNYQNENFAVAGSRSGSPVTVVDFPGLLGGGNTQRDKPGSWVDLNVLQRNVPGPATTADIEDLKLYINNIMDTKTDNGALRQNIDNLINYVWPNMPLKTEIEKKLNAIIQNMATKNDITALKNEITALKNEIKKIINKK